MTVHDIAKTERIEMYLKAVYTIQHTAPPATVSKVAEYMGVSLPSASEMLKRLETQRFVTSTPEDGARLTDAGRAVAIQVVRRLRLAERLLTDVLGLALPQVYDEACKLEHVISPEVEARLDEVLGHPTTCPHGLPIPNGGADSPPPDVPSLADLAPGTMASVAAVPEEDTALLTYLTGLGLVPGVEVRLQEVAPFNGPIFFEVAGTRRAIGREAAGRVKVVKGTSA
ncbi:MAG: metal-dependent transcriptional regulator [Armatimonadetes bacterium]|nr:metal-dependent transcriptional regulator [Armatimonadota bacterium]